MRRATLRLALCPTVLGAVLAAPAAGRPTEGWYAIDAYWRCQGEMGIDQIKLGFFGPVMPGTPVSHGGATWVTAKDVTELANAIARGDSLGDGMIPPVPPPPVAPAPPPPADRPPGPPVALSMLDGHWMGQLPDEQCGGTVEIDVTLKSGNAEGSLTFHGGATASGPPPLTISFSGSFETAEDTPTQLTAAAHLTTAYGATYPDDERDAHFILRADAPDTLSTIGGATLHRAKAP